MRKSYELWLHFKQGDDLAECLETAKNPSEALQKWSDSMMVNWFTIQRIAVALEGKDVEIEADTHMICIHPKNKAATTALENLRKAGLLDVEQGEG